MVSSRRFARTIGLVIVLAAFALVSTEARELTLEFQFNRMNRIASNQIAVWIEDSSGHLVKTLFVTDFTARKAGYRRRAAALPVWVSVYRPGTHPSKEVDGISRATPKSGRVTISWDGTDQSGRTVAPGAYVLHIEGNIFWENMVYFSVPLDVGATPFSFEARPTEGSADPTADLPLITEVRVRYLP
ncbi:MAG TPA: DUF2271 domain-containing protein [Spirochaetia bacterium]|nr:DUF2271 domain-containing protein [Spirochaetia bacterium]